MNHYFYVLIRESDLPDSNVFHFAIPRAKSLGHAAELALRRARKKGLQTPQVLEVQERLYGRQPIPEIDS
jgi:hypothetical protein